MPMAMKARNFASPRSLFFKTAQFQTSTTMWGEEKFPRFRPRRIVAESQKIFMMPRRNEKIALKT
jgi:hypothetical protein